METPAFPPLLPQISELYGASGGALRVGEADAYKEELDELEREERALEKMVQDLVHRQAAPPIGVKFHRDVRASLQPSESFESGEVAPDPELPFEPSGSSEEDDMEDMEEEDEEEEEEDQRATIERPRTEDSFEQDDSDESMDMDMETELPPPGDWS